MTKRKVKSLILVLLAILCIVVAAIFGSNVKTAKALPDSSVSTLTTEIGELVSNYNSSTNSFNGDITFDSDKLQQLYDAILGGTNKKYSDVKAAVSGTYQWVGSGGNVPSPNGTIQQFTTVTLPQRILAVTGASGDKTLPKPIVVSLAGKKWLVTYVTRTSRDDSGNDIADAVNGGDVIVDLWELNSTKTSQWAKYSGSTPASTYPAYMYSTSYIRNYVLGIGESYATGVSSAVTPSTVDTTYSLYAKGALTNFLATPNQLKYQEHESWVGDDRTWSCIVNEAYGRPYVELYFDSNNASSNDGFASSAGSNGCATNIKPRYNDWKNDYIWLPSLTEVGCNGNATYHMPGIWGLGEGVLGNQLRSNTTYNKPSSDPNSSYSIIWLRSGLPKNGSAVADSVYWSYDGGDYASGSATRSYAVRPAIHFNLTKAAKKAVATPKDVTTTYNGSSQWIGDSAIKTANTWIDGAVHCDVNIVSIDDIKYKSCTPAATFTSIGKNKADIKNAGFYQVTLKLADTTNYSWSGSTSATQTFQIEVKQKSVGLTVGVDSNGKPEVRNWSGLCTADSSSPPSVIFKYKSADYAESEQPPTAIGNYTATAYLADNYGNYLLNGTFTTSITVTARKVAEPSIKPGETTQVYNGKDWTFTPYNSDGTTKINPDDIELSVGSSGASVSADNLSFTAKNAGTYNVELKLKDTTNTQWASGSTQPIPLTFTITQKSVTLSIDNSLINWTWEKGKSGNLTATAEGFVATDAATLTLYAESGGQRQYINTATKAADGTSVSTSVTLKTEDFAIGTYNINAELDATSAKNYTLNPNITLPKEANVTAEGVSFTGVTWQYTHDGVDLKTAATTGTGDDLTFDNATDKLVYRLKNDNTASEYKFEIDISALPAGVKLDTAEGTNGYDNNTASAAGTHKATVYLVCDSDYSFPNGDVKKECTISFEIERGTFDTTSLKWQYLLTGESAAKEYKGPLEYAGKDYTVTLMPTGLPKGLSVDSYVNNKEKAVTPTGTKYKAKATFSCDEKNFVKPDPLEFEWEIVPAEIKVDWDFGQTPPVLTDPRAAGGVVVYTLYKDAACTDQITTITPDPTKKVMYYVKAELDPIYSGNYKLTDASGTFSTGFSVGGTKTALSATVTFGDDVYNGAAHEATVTIKGEPGFSVENNCVLTYYSVADDGTETKLEAAPKDAGKYCVVVSLTKDAAADYEITGETKFTFEIKKATLDISGIKWNYTEAFQYGTKDGTPIEYTVELSGLPEYLQGIVKYQDNKSSAYGERRAAFEFDGFDTNNYEELVYPEGFEKELVWKIDVRVITKPVAKPARAHYTGSELTAEIDGFDAEYMEIVSGELKGTEIGDYSVVVAFKDSVKTYMRWDDKSNKEITITFKIISPGEPLDPDNPDVPPTPDNPDDPTPVDPNNPDNPDNPNDDKPVGPGVTKPDDNNNGGGSVLPDGFPLWQVIVGSVSILLIVGFTIKIASNVRETNDCRRRSNSMGGPAYAGVMVNGMLFGVSNTWWTVIALSLAGIAVILFIIMMVTGSKLHRERTKLEDMKMMFLMMNKGNQSQPASGGYTVNVPQIDMDDLAKRVAAALLPSMQSAAQLTAGSGEYDDAELRRRMAESERRIEELEGRDDGFDDVIEVDMDEFKD